MKRVIKTLLITAPTPVAARQIGITLAARFPEVPIEVDGHEIYLSDAGPVPAAAIHDVKAWALAWVDGYLFANKEGK